MKKIGLTGNSGSGKSSVAEILRKHGAHIIDADSISHSVIKRGQPAYDEILQSFTDDILNPQGEIDRKKLGALVFANEEKRRRLMEITHRHIIAEMLAQLELYSKTANYVVMDAPLLIEAGLHKHTDEVWVVHAREDLRLERVTKRDGIEKSQAIKRLRSQTSFDELKKYANVIIENNSDLATLELEIKNVLRDKS